MKIAIEIVGLDLKGLIPSSSPVKEEGEAGGKQVAKSEDKQSWYCMFFVAGTLFFLVYAPVNMAAKGLIHYSSSAPKAERSSTTASLKYIYPVNAPVTSPFGKRESPTEGASSFHQGIDFGAEVGTPILASQSGLVEISGVMGGFGNVVVIQHENGIKTIYGHCSELKVRTGQKVSQGDVIALVGSTGISTGPHLHFGVKKNGQWINPMEVLGVRG
jgi:murein DD-endopeptidase MepM/ murein hydrolase activator NlpD